MFSQKEIEKFWSKIDKERSSIFYKGKRCWEWTLSCDTSGYGQMSINGKAQLVHRMSYEIHFGSFDKRLHVLHGCDNRRCVNPSHLWLGTNKDNVDDMNLKGRHANFQGELNPSCKLSDEQVYELRRRYESGEKHIASLAREFGISRRQARRLALRQSRA